MAEPVVLSASSVQTFLRCGHQWYLANVVRLREPPKVRMSLGTAAHSAVEHNMVQKILTKTDVDADEMTDVFSSNFDELMTEIEDPDEDIGKAKDDGIGLVKLHRKMVSPMIQPIWVEKAGQLEVDGVPYSWVVDLVDDKDRVRDLKTKKARPRIDEYLLGMTGYALGFRQETGRKESDIVIDGLVRTKVPQYVPLYGGQVSDQRIESFSDTLGTISHAIERGDFVPNGLTSGACNWCGFANSCKYRKS